MNLFRKVFIRFLIVPTNWVYLICVLSFIYINVWLGLLFIIIFPLLFNFIPYFLIKKLELKFNNLNVFQGNEFYHIIVLGGGHEPSNKLYPEQQLNNTSLRRVLEGVRLFKANPNANLIMTGENLKLNHPSQAELQFKVAVTMGVSPVHIKAISNPKNTEEEAESYFSLFADPEIPVVIVTKAIHLRRAGRLFNRNNCRLYLSPAYFYHTEFYPSIYWFGAPDFRLISVFSEYLKEVFGYLFLELKENTFNLKKYIFRSNISKNKKWQPV